MIATKIIQIVHDSCQGIYLRWWFNGWHYYNFGNAFEVSMRTTTIDVQTTEVFSAVSRVERATKTKTDYSYNVRIDGIMPANLDGFANMLLAERVEQYEGGLWREVDVTRGDKTLHEDNSPAYSLEFEITCKELPDTPAVFQRTQYFYIGDTLADLDEDEVIAVNKQVNNIAELQDRQSDFTAQFKVRKTRAMRALFELSGEVGSNTEFPYQQQACRLVQDGIEIISAGRMSLNKVDANYYYVAVYSGNKSIFEGIAKLKLTDLLLPNCAHTWEVATQAATHASDLDYLYPLVEPSDDGGLIPLYADGNEATLSGETVWPFVKLRAIWDEIFTNASYTVQGAILNNPKFNALFMPITNRKAGDASKYLYSLYNNTTKIYPAGDPTELSHTGNIVINGADDTDWATNVHYTPRYNGNYKFRLFLVQKFGGINLETIQVFARVGITDTEIPLTQGEYAGNFRRNNVFEGELEAVAGVQIMFVISKCLLYYFDVAITAIESPLIGYNSEIANIALNLPETTQGDFVKAICNMFGLVPEANGRERRIFFWNYELLYAKIPQARDWSPYLSETGGEVEFKFGDFAQRNYMKYKESEDVLPDNGKGLMQINDETLAEEKDMLTLPFAYSDEVLVLFNQINVSRIGMNKYEEKQDTYTAADKIDPRIVHTSVVTGKVFNITPVGSPASETPIINPRKASSIEVSFGSLGVNYAYLAAMLTKPKLIRAKFNLPIFEVAGLRHYVPVYLEQYKAYFYVNKISNYVVGRLCTIDLIKL